MKQYGLGRPLAFLLALCLLAGSAFAFCAEPVWAGAYEAPLLNVINNYYGGSQENVLDDWEELAAVYAWLSGQPGSSYESGIDLSDWVLPDAGSGAGGLFRALMKGDAATATVLANGLVAGGVIVDPGSVYTYALQVLALEAFNRSAGITPVAYDAEAAADHMLDAQDPAGGYLDWGMPSYDNGGMVLAALSLPVFDVYPGIAGHRSDLAAWIRAGQSASGAYQAFGADSANSTACVLYGLSASGEDLSVWTTSPAIGLVSNAVYNEADGWFTSWSGAWNAYATKQAALALAGIETGRSFYVNVELNPIAHKCLEVQVVEPDGTYTEKQITAPETSTLDEIVDLTIGSSRAGSYNYYVNGVSAPAAADGDTVLAVADVYDGLAYFSLAGSGLGVPRAAIPFEGTASFTLRQLTLADSTDVALGSIGVDVNGDGYGDLTTTTAGALSWTPVGAVTRLDALATHSDPVTYAPVRDISDTVALLPAYIDMASGGAQNKTVSVRVEGPSENIIYYSAFDVTGSGADRLTAGDAVTQALTAAGKTYTYSAGYLSEVEGTFAGSMDPSFYDGWVYFMNGQPGSGLGGQVIDDDDEIIVYYGYYPGWGTDLVRLTSEASGSQVTLRVLRGDTPVQGVSILWQGVQQPGATDAEGTLRISDVPPGTYTVQIAKSDEHGVPQVVRLPAGTTVTVTAQGGTSHGGGTGDTQTSAVIYLTVKGLRGATLYPRAEHTYYVGMTARDALDESDLTISGSGNYVSAINGLAEFDHGPGSGWLYMVNGELSGTISADDYRLEADDSVLWYYTSDYTSDRNVQSSLGDLEEELLPEEELPGDAGPAFSDVPEGAWYRDAAQSVVRQGLFRGVSDTDFGPDLPMTREMFVTVLGRLHEAGGASAAGGPAGFSDAAAGAYYEQYMAWASGNGIVLGLDGSRFGVGVPVTREQMVTFVYRYFLSQDLIEEGSSGDMNSFGDADSISDWAADAFRWAVGKGLITGRSSGLLDPAGSSSRAEVAMFILRCFNMIHENTV